jgi:Protein of unknown function (DUF2887)
MKTDSLFYRVFQTLPGLFFDLIGLSSLAAEQYRFHSVELKQTALRLDGLFKPPTTRPVFPYSSLRSSFKPTPCSIPACLRRSSSTSASISRPTPGRRS